MNLWLGISQIKDNSFKFTINTALGTGNSMQLPLVDGQTYNFIVDWGDDNQDIIIVYNQAETLHNYNVGGIYQISITGKCGGWSFNDVGDKLKITSINQWGNVRFDYLVSAFRGCSNLISIPQEPFPYSNITHMSGFFMYSTGLSGTKIPSNFLYLMSNLTDLQQAFQGVNMDLYDDFLRYCPNLTNVSYLHYAINLTDKNIPEDYFYYNSLVTNYSYIFYGARNMILPTRLFNLSALSIVANFSNFMTASSIAYSNTGTIQSIWDYALSAISTDAFLNQTALTNYASIPNDWKGL